MKYRIRRPSPGLFLALAFYTGVSSVPISRAAVVITSEVTFNAGPQNYTYSYSVTNTIGSVEDLILVTIPADKMSNITGSAAPQGFEIAFDPGQGWVNLLEDSSIVTPQTFAPGTTIAPFTYTSFYPPQAVTYSAFDAAGNEFTGVTQSPIPEPSGVLLAGVALLHVLSRRRHAFTQAA